jgi:integrase
MDAIGDWYAPTTIGVKSVVLMKIARAFDEFCERDPEAIRDPNKWTEREVSAIVIALRPSGISRNSQAQQLGVLEGFLRYLGNGIMDSMRARTIQVFPRLVYVRKPALMDEELSKILRACDGIGGWRGECIRFMFWTYAFTGLRLSELRRAGPSDLDTQQWTLRVSHPKGERSYGTYRTVPVPEPLKPIVVGFLKAREERLNGLGVLESPYLVFGDRGHMKPIAPGVLRSWKVMLEKRSGVEFTVHALRRTYGQTLLNRGVPLESVSLALGHASTLTTEKHYARRDPRLAGREIADAFARPRTGPSLNTPLIDKKIDYTGYA